jgi:hypothetical protein
MFMAGSKAHTSTEIETALGEVQYDHLQSGRATICRFGAALASKRLASDCRCSQEHPRRITESGYVYGWIQGPYFNRN